MKKSTFVLILFLIFTPFLWATEPSSKSDDSDVKEIYKLRRTQYETITNVFKKFGLNPEKFNDVVLGTDSQGVRDQLDRLSGDLEALEKRQTEETTTKADLTISMNSELAKLKAKLYQAEEDSTPQGYFSKVKHYLLNKILIPLGKKVMIIAMNPEVIEATVALHDNPNMTNLLLINIVFLALIVLYKIFKRKHYVDRFFTKIAKGITLLFVVTLCSSVIIPTFVLGKPYLHLLKSLYDSTKQEVLKKNS